jgi:hypothetical protein
VKIGKCWHALLCLFGRHVWVQTRPIDETDTFPPATPTYKPVRRYCAWCRLREVYLPGYGEPGCWIPGHNALPYPEPEEVELETVATTPPTARIDNRPPA